MQGNKIRKGLIFKLSIVLLVALFACILMSSAVAQGSGENSRESRVEGQRLSWRWVVILARMRVRRRRIFRGMLRFYRVRRTLFLRLCWGI